MRPSPKTMFRGLGKFITVAVVAALVGAAIGVGLASLTDDSTSTTTTVAPTVTVTPVPPVQPVAPPPPPPPPPPPAATKTQTNPTTPRLVGPVPKVAIASAVLGPAAADGTAPVTASVTVTNRYKATLPAESPVLVSDSDEVALDSGAKSAAGPLLNTLNAGATATGELHFTLPSAVAQRLRGAPNAQLRIAGRTVALKLTLSG